MVFKENNVSLPISTGALQLLAPKRLIAKLDHSMCSCLLHCQGNTMLHAFTTLGSCNEQPVNGSCNRMKIECIAIWIGFPFRVIKLMKDISLIIFIYLVCIAPWLSHQSSSSSSSDSSYDYSTSDSQSSSYSAVTDDSEESSLYSSGETTDYSTTYSHSNSSSSYAIMNADNYESGRPSLMNRLFKSLYSIPFIQPLLRRMCFNVPPQDAFHQRLAGVRPRSVFADSAQVIVWSFVFSLIKLFVFTDYSSMGTFGCIWFVAYDIMSGGIRYVAILLLQRFENQARQLYKEHGWSLNGPYRNKCQRKRQQESVKNSLRNPIANALFNWSDQSKAKWIALGKILLVSLGVCALRHLIFLDSLFLVNGFVDLLWLVSFWLIVLMEYLRLPTPVLPLLVGLQTIIFR